MKQSTFNFFITKTISNTYLHIFLMFFEYICFIFPSSIDAAIKLNYYNSTIENYYKHTPNLNEFMIFKYLHFNNNTLLPLTIVIISLILVIIYAILNCFETLENKFIKCCDWFLANVYNLLLFRYFSSFVLDSILLLFIHYSKEGNQLQISFSIFFLIFWIIFAIINYSFIIECSIILNISNHELVDQYKQYPYDQLTKRYEVIIFFIKLLTAMEYTYFQHSGTINLVLISLNSMIVGLGLILFFWLFINNTYFYGILSFYFANVKYNVIQKGLSIFNCFFTVVGLLIFKKEATLYNMIILSVLSLNMTLIILFFEYYYLRKKNILKTSLSYKTILLMLILDSSDKEMLRRIKSLQDLTIRNHQLNCKYNKNKPTMTCYLCQNYSFNIKENITILYNYLNKYQRNKKESEPLYEELTKLFFYKINKKPFKYYNYYYVLMHKYNNANKHYSKNISLLTNIWLHDINNTHIELIEYILKVNVTEKKIKALLVDLNDFFNESLSLKRPETAFKLSSDLENAICDTKDLVNHSSKITLSLSQSSSQSLLHSETILKTINEAINYNITILRYILETLTNQSLNTLSPLNIEYLEDYLSLHFESDKILICSIDLASVFNQDIKIIKSSGNIVDYDNSNTLLTDYFPKDIIKEGIELFKQQINIDSNEKFNSKSITFYFPFMKKGLIQYMKYDFKIVKMLNSSDMFVFGHYIQTKHKTILLNFNHPKVVIMELCKEFLNLIHFKTQWFMLLKELNINLYLSSIFETMKFIDNNEDECKLLECYLDKNYLFDNMRQIFIELEASMDYTSNDKPDVSMVEFLDKIRKYNGELITITLEKIIEYKKGICLYKIDLTSKELQISNITNSKRNSINNDKSEEINDYMPKNNYIHNLQSSVSISSMSKESISINEQTKNNLNSSVQILNDVNLQNKISPKVKKLSFFTFIMVGLNLFLIIFCCIFLITQIYLTNQLYSLSLLYFYFKRIRWIIVNFLLSLLTTICYSSTPRLTSNCINGYENYTEVFQKNYNLPKEYSFYELVSYELKYKTEYALETLNQFKFFLYNSIKSSDEYLVHLLDNTFSFYEFIETEDSNELIKQNITFEEGIRKYINSFIQLHDTLDSDLSYVHIPIYFIRYENGEYIFRDSTLINISPIQKEIYKILTNYFNFFISFSQGDDTIKTLIQSLFNSNYVMTISFMVTISLFNILLCIICKNNINTAYNIFKILIYNIVNQTEKSDNAIVIKSKMDNLLILVHFYKKNPNILIPKIEKITMARLKNHKSNKLIEENNKKKDNTISTSYGSFYYYLLGSLIRLLMIAFALFFSIVIVFDCVLVIQFNNLLDLYNYIVLTYNNDHTLLTNIAMGSLSHIVNISNEDLSIFWGEKVPKETIFDDKVKDNLKLFNQLLVYTNLNSSNYPVFEHKYTYNCDVVFKEMNESHVIEVSNELNKDYRVLQAFVCNIFDLLNTPNLNYVRGDIATRTLQVFHKNLQTDYDSLYDYANDFQSYSLLTIAIIFFRSVSKTFKETVLLPKLTSSFDIYIALVITYLVVNICLEIILFIAVRWGISKTINQIQSNLYLLNNCVS